MIFPLFIFLEVHWSVVNTIFGGLGFVECLICVLIFSPLCLPESPFDQLYIILIGIFSFIAQIGLVVSSQLESASTVAILRKAFDVIFAFIFQISFFQVCTFKKTLKNQLVLFLKK